MIQKIIQSYDWNKKNNTEYTEKIHTVLHCTPRKAKKILNTILNDKQIQEAKKLKQIGKHEYQEKSRQHFIQTTLKHYVETQKNLRKIINDYITRVREKKLQSIYRNGYNSKSYWSIIQQLRQNNVEDLYALKNYNGVRLFSEGKIKNCATTIRQANILKTFITNIRKTMV